jgi:hypothetical protein
MPRSTASAYRLFLAAARKDRLPPEATVTARTRVPSQPLRRRARELAPLPTLAPYNRCTCGSCPACIENARWDQIFARFEVKDTEVRGLYGCALVDL